MREITDNHNIIHSNYKDQIHRPYDLNLFISKFDFKKIIISEPANIE